MRPLRIFFCLFAGCASLVALAHHLGFDLWGCASCSFVNELPMSAALAWGGPVALFALAYALFAELRWAKAALGLAALGSLTGRNISLFSILLTRISFSLTQNGMGNR